MVIVLPWWRAATQKTVTASRPVLMTSIASFSFYISHKGSPQSHCLISLSNFTLVTGYNRTIKLWDTRKGSMNYGATYVKVATLVGHNGPVKAIAFSPDGNFLVSGCEDSHIFIWNARNAKVSLPTDFSP